MLGVVISLVVSTVVSTSLLVATTVTTLVFHATLTTVRLGYNYAHRRFSATTPDPQLPPPVLQVPESSPDNSGSAPPPIEGSGY